MGNKNKKSSTSVKKQSSYIPVQEFVDKFTASFEEILRRLLLASETHTSKEYTAKTNTWRRRGLTMSATHRNGYFMAISQLISFDSTLFDNIAWFSFHILFVF